MTSIFRRIQGRLDHWPSLLLILCSLFWAGNTIAGRLAVGEISPFMLVLLRWAIVLAVLWPLYGAEMRAAWPEIRPSIGRITMMAALGFTVFNALFYIAARYTGAVNLGILQGSMPVFVLLMAFLAHGARASPRQMTGVLITLIGVAAVATRGNLAGLMALDYNRGDLFMLAACFLYAYYTVALRDRPKVSGAAFFTLLAVVAAVTAIPLVIAEIALGTSQLPTLKGLLITLYVAVFPSCLAQLFFMRGVDLIGPSRAGVFINLVPVFSAILAVCLLGEEFAWFHALSLVLVLGGIWLAQRQS